MTTALEDFLIEMGTALRIFQGERADRVSQESARMVIRQRLLGRHECGRANVLFPGVDINDCLVRFDGSQMSVIWKADAKQGRWPSLHSLAPHHFLGHLDELDVYAEVLGDKPGKSNWALVVKGVAYKARVFVFSSSGKIPLDQLTKEQVVEINHRMAALNLVKDPR